MSEVSLTADGFVVDAGIVGAAFDLPPADVPAKLRLGQITSRCETSVDDDAGRWRLTFYCGGRGLRLGVDASGAISLAPPLPRMRQRRVRLTSPP